MHFSIKKSFYRMKVDKDGKADEAALPQFEVGFTTAEEKNEAQNYFFQIAIVKTPATDFSGLKAWKKNESFGDRRNWTIYRVKVPVTELKQVGTNVTFTVDLVWWRDCARVLKKSDPDQEYNAYLVWEGSTDAHLVWDNSSGEKKSNDDVVSCKFKIQSCLGRGLELRTIKNCLKNRPNQGFAHLQQIKILHKHGAGMYGIVQWVRGVFIRWNDDKIYQYLKFPSCGEELQGYVPSFGGSSRCPRLVNM